MEVERQLEAAEMEIVPSWGTGRQVWGTGIMTAVTMRWEMGTGIELRVGSEPRLNLLKICEKREKKLLQKKRQNKINKGNTHSVEKTLSTFFTTFFANALSLCLV